MPELAHFIDAEIPFEFKNRRHHKEYNLFEIFGRNCYTFEYDNVLPLLMKEDFIIYFSYSYFSMWIKMAYLFVLSFIILFSFFILYNTNINIDEKVSSNKKSN